MEINFIPKLAFDCLNESYDDTGSLSAEKLEILHSFFGNHLVLATELLEKSKIIEYTLDNNLRRIFKVVSSKEQYTIYDNINFCHCDIFSIEVLQKRNAITCKHVLTARLGQITNRTIKETVTGSQLVDFLNEQIHFVESNNEC